MKIKAYPAQNGKRPKPLRIALSSFHMIMFGVPVRKSQTSIRIGRPKPKSLIKRIIKPVLKRKRTSNYD